MTTPPPTPPSAAPILTVEEVATVERLISKNYDPLDTGLDPRLPVFRALVKVLSSEQALRLALHTAEAERDAALALLNEVSKHGLHRSPVCLAQGCDLPERINAAALGYPLPPIIEATEEKP